MKIAMTSIFVDDPIKAFQIYTEKLGFIKKQYLPEAQLAVVASPEEPNGTALLLEPNSNPIAKNYQEQVYQAGIPVMVFGTDDIAAEYQRLKDKGIQFRGEPTKTEWGTLVLFEDGCGNLIQLHQA